MSDEVSDVWILDDANFKRDSETGEPETDVESKFFSAKGKYLGHALFAQPPDQYTKINPTTALGKTTGAMQSVTIQLKKWQYLGVHKVEDILEVTPAYAQYYQLTIKQKEEIENKIKEGLRSVSQSVSDLELLKHDERKYKEFLDYMGEKYNEDNVKNRWEKVKEVDEHALRAIFVDMVDAHTGESIAMKNIVSRWPTLITDFMKLENDFFDVDKITEDLDVTRAEAVVLSTKNRLYCEWKSLFTPEIKDRYERIVQLRRSRDASIEEYRKWLAPHISRHKMLNEALESTELGSEFNTNHLWSQSQGLALNITKFWAWRDWTTRTIFGGVDTEEEAIRTDTGQYRADDAWTRKNLIFHEGHGLIKKYDWITDEWVDKKLKQAISGKMILRNKPYYTFAMIMAEKANIRLPDGTEFEDNEIYVSHAMMSQNILFCKILELFAEREKFENHVNRLIGIPIKMPPPREMKKGRFHKLESVKKSFEDIGLGLQLFKRGPYEKDFIERISKHYLRAMAPERYSPLVNLIKQKTGVGQ